MSMIDVFEVDRYSTSELTFFTKPHDSGGQLAGQDVKKVFIDNESSVDIIFKHALKRMILNTPFEEMKYEDVQGPVYGFGSHDVPVLGVIDIPTTFGMSPQEVTALVKYYIIDMASPYNAIIGQPTLFFLGAIISSSHMKVKFPTPYGEPKGGVSSRAPKIPKAETSQVLLIESSFSYTETSLSKAELHHTPKPEPGEPVENIELTEGDPSRCIFISSRLPDSLKQKLILLLREFHDIFAWKPEDMPDIDESIVIHRLHIDPNKAAVKQKRRNFAPERQQAIDEEISKLLKANFI
ncbi:uncharacterized protein LOC141673158 [Apium graveolens]|uniref:uncharacterized protein LOC141673158 n=1 Tax=Apium graveolens TaxID=4045 RepID=UPI003D7B1CF6